MSIHAQKSFRTGRLLLSLAPLLLAAAGGCSGDDSDDSPTAVVKFCNPLSRNDMMPLDLTLEVGSDKVVTLMAGSQSCSPRVKESCLKIPVGKAVPFTLKLGADKIAADNLEVAKDEEWIIYADLDDMTRQPFLNGASIDTTKARCTDLDFNDIFSAGGGGSPPPGGGPTLPPGA